MNGTLQLKRALLWGLGSLLILGLTSAAWAQIQTALARCFQGY